MSKKYWRIVYGMILLVSVVFCLRLIHEPDLWWQLRTGEFILEHREVPKVDVFSYTYEGQPWVNVKWGYEVIQATLVKLFGAEFLFIPQLAANVLLLIFLFFIMREWNSRKSISNFAITSTLYLFLIGFSYRMNGRPELTSYVFTVVYLYLFVRIKKGDFKAAYFLIPLQLLWANLHEGFGVGIVMMGIFLFTLWLDYLKLKLKSDEALKLPVRISAIAILAYLSVVIHPSGSTMLIYPYNIFSQLSANQFTAEIFNAFNAEYWEMPAFVSVLFAFLSLIQLNKLSLNQGKHSIKTLLENVPLFYVLLFFAFFYLNLKAYRNIPFFLIVASPFVVSQLSEFTKFLKDKTAWIIALSFSILLYISIISNAFYNAFLPAEQYGIGINPKKNSIDAANFIKENKLSGNAFSDYLGSSYLLWHLQPDFKTFVDLRDLDVFEPDDMDVAIACAADPTRQTQDGRTIWQIVDGAYNFNYVIVLNNPAFQKLHRFLIASQTYEAVYGDELCTIYVKRRKTNNDLIKKFGLNNDNDIFHSTSTLNASAFGYGLSKFFNPLYRAKEATASETSGLKNAYYIYLGFMSN